VAVAFAEWRVRSKLVRGGTAGPGNGQCDKRHEQTELARIGQAGVLDIEAAGLCVAEQAFDRPTFAVGPQRDLRLDIGDHDQPLVLERLGGDGQQWRIACGGVFARAETGSEDPASPSLAQSDPQGQVMPLRGGDAEIVSDADGKGDIVFTQEFHPVSACEFPVGQQHTDGRGG
jgi:hypothetical protein